MPRDPQVLLDEVRTAVQRIQRFTVDRDLQDYQQDEMLRASVERMYILIGEALSRLAKADAATAERITDYRNILVFRNVLVHGYESVRDEIVWSIMQNQLPLLASEVDALISAPGS